MSHFTYLFYTVICAWCGKHLSGPATTNPEEITHGICAECKAKMEQEIK